MNYTFVASRWLEDVLIDALAPGDEASVRDPAGPKDWRTNLVRLTQRRAFVQSIRWDGGPAWRLCRHMEVTLDTDGLWAEKEDD